MSPKCFCVSADRNILYRGTSLQPWRWTSRLSMARCTRHLAVQGPQRLSGTPQLFQCMMYTCIIRCMMDDLCFTIHMMFSAFIETQLSCRKQSQYLSIVIHHHVSIKLLNGLCPNVSFLKLLFGARSTSWGPKFDSQEQRRKTYCLVLSSGQASYKKEIQQTFVWGLGQNFQQASAILCCRLLLSSFHSLGNCKVKSRGVEPGTSSPTTGEAEAGGSLGIKKAAE